MRNSIIIRRDNINKIRGYLKAKEVNPNNKYEFSCGKQK